jgi:5-methyltetrahydropteroyltriglutamate--homocysteine methyltransferase
VHYHLRHLGGIDFSTLTERKTRGGSWVAKIPTVTGKITTGPNFLADDWKRAQANTDRPVKITMPGPMTILDSVVDKHYPDPQSLAADLADALNYEARSLADAGCKFIQIDEPVFARKAADAKAWGVAILARAFEGIGPDVTRVVHMCCGYPSGLDLEDFPKAPRASYFELAKDIDAEDIDCVSIEDAHRHNDLTLLEHFAKTSVILGVVQIAATRIETVEEIRQRLKNALDHIDKDRLIAGPDCGLAMLDRGTVFAKLKNMCDAAQSV